MGAAPYRVTLNEVLRLSRRVCLALGIGPGCEHEPARAVTWLEARDLPGLLTLWTDLERLRERAGRGMEVLEDDVASGGLVRVDGAGTSALFAVPGALDWLLTLPQGVRLSLTGVHSPLFALAALAERPVASGLWVRAQDAAGIWQLSARIDAGSRTAVSAAGDVEGLAGVATTLLMGRGCGPADGDAGAVVRVCAAALDRRYRQSLEQGITMDPALWLRLAGVARESLVPESRASRARGAGGGDDNA